MANLIKNENVIRLGFFFGMLFIICVWELISPRRKLTQKKFVRWPSNFGIVIINTFLLRVIFPTTAVGMAAAGKE